jgi:hypothetical protein
MSQRKVIEGVNVVMCRITSAPVMLAALQGVQQLVAALNAAAPAILVISKSALA